MGNFVGIFIGGWTDGDDWTATHANWVQDSITKTINASEGSSHAPTSAIEIAAAGLVLTDVVAFVPDDNTATFADGALVFVGANGTWTFQADAELDMASGSVLSVSGGFAVQSGASVEVFSGATVIIHAGTTATFSGDVDFASGSTLDINSGAVATVKSGAALTANAGSAVTLAGTNTISGATAVSGAVTRTSKETRSGTGARTAVRTTNLTPNTSANISVNFDHYRFEQSNLTNHVLTALVTTSPAPTTGEIIDITVVNTAPNPGALVTIESEGAANNIFQTAKSFSCSIIFDGTAWRFHSVGQANIDVYLGSGA